MVIEKEAIKIINIKQYLKQYRSGLQELQEITERIVAVRSQAEKVTATLTGMPGAPAGTMTGDNLQRCIDMLDELERRYVDRLKETVQMLTSIEDDINALSDERYRQVVRMWYISGASWPTIAAEMHYTERQVQNLHGRALQALEALKNIS